MKNPITFNPEHEDTAELEMLRRQALIHRKTTRKAKSVPVHSKSLEQGRRTCNLPVLDKYSSSFNYQFAEKVLEAKNEAKANGNSTVALWAAEGRVVLLRCISSLLVKYPERSAIKENDSKSGKLFGLIMSFALEFDPIPSQGNLDACNRSPSAGMYCTNVNQ